MNWDMWTPFLGQSICFCLEIVTWQLELQSSRLLYILVLSLPLFNIEKNDEDMNIFFIMIERTSKFPVLILNGFQICGLPDAGLSIKALWTHGIYNVLFSFFPVFYCYNVLREENSIEVIIPNVVMPLL